MTFSAWTSTLGQRFGEGSREYIFAGGYFCSDTDQKFQMFLTQNPPKAPNTIVVLNSAAAISGLACVRAPLFATTKCGPRSARSFR